MMDAFSERMQQLRTRFTERALRERDELQAALSTGDHATAIRILHSLAGNAGMFGYPKLSVAARELEEALERRGEGSGPDRDLPQMLQELWDEFPGRQGAVATEPR